MFRGGEPVEVEIEFDEYQSRWMRERGPFHPTERRDELPGGRLKLTMQVTALDGVKRFVMQYGAHATVITPEELRQVIRGEIDMMRGIYSHNE
jgi:predicted DNA-binding transcriptional regulator YafY